MMHTTQAQIRDLEEQVRLADVVTDPDLLDELLVDGFSFTSHDGTIFSKEQVLQAHRPAGVRKFETFETSDLQIRAFDEAAVVTVRADFTTTRMRASLLFTRFWLKIGGRWRIVGGSAVELEHAHQG
ncbi:MAG TPA: nuclear transport factor 2 family protein [Candidatus Baltobacteraceae bacterium]